MSSYLPPATRVQTRTTPGLRNLHLEPPTETTTSLVHPPDLPSPAREAALKGLYTLSTHLIPAQRTRISPQVPVPAADGSKEGRERVVREIIDSRRRYDADQAGGTGGMAESPAGLWNCVNRYVRKELPPVGTAGKPLTLFFAHAIGFMKEIWEPTLQHLIAHPQTGYYIAEIWSWDAIHHGDAARVNAGNLSGVFDWRDNTRDMLNFLLYYLPSSHEGQLPTHLVPVTDAGAEGTRRAKAGFRDRTLMVVAHSFGACAAALAAMYHPALFSALILVDPVIDEDYYEERLRPHVVGAIKRRTTWNSREEALTQLKRLPFFAGWDPTVLKTYVEHGLYDTADGTVALKTESMQEAITYIDTRLAREVYHRMWSLDERVVLHWVVSDRTELPSGKTPEEDHEVTRRRVWLRLTNSSNAVLKAGHLIPQEAPRELAYELHMFMERKYGARLNDASSPAGHPKL